LTNLNELEMILPEYGGQSMTTRVALVFVLSAVFVACGGVQETGDGAEFGGGSAGNRGGFRSGQKATSPMVELTVSSSVTGITELNDRFIHSVRGGQRIGCFRQRSGNTNGFVLVFSNEHSANEDLKRVFVKAVIADPGFWNQFGPRTVVASSVVIGLSEVASWSPSQINGLEKSAQQALGGCLAELNREEDFVEAGFRCNSVMKHGRRVDVAIKAKCYLKEL